MQYKLKNLKWTIFYNWTFQNGRQRKQVMWILSKGRVSVEKYFDVCMSHMSTSLIGKLINPQQPKIGKTTKCLNIKGKNILQKHFKNCTTE